LMALSPLRRFLLAALLWLPFAFFVWFYFAAPLVWPVIALVRFVLLTAWPIAKAPRLSCTGQWIFSPMPLMSTCR